MEVPKNEPPTAQENPKMRSNLMFSLYFSQGIPSGERFAQDSNHLHKVFIINKLRRTPWYLRRNSPTSAGERDERKNSPRECSRENAPSSLFADSVVPFRRMLLNIEVLNGLLILRLSARDLAASRQNADLGLVPLATSRKLGTS